MTSHEHQQVDNLIIGGGLAGLYCAWQLQQQNREFHLLEAQSFSGGRIRPVNDSIHVDTGATWFWPHQKSVLGLGQKLGLQIIEQYINGDTLFQQPDGNVETMSYQQGLSYKFKGGATALVNNLTAKLPRETLSFNSPVTAIEKCNGAWLVSCRSAQDIVYYLCRNMFIAIPPRMVLKHLTPKLWLPDNAIEHLSLQQTWMSAQAKYIAVYEQPIWRQKGHSGFAISHRGPLVEIHDATTDTGHYALFGFVGVPAIQRANVTPLQLKLACREQLSLMFDLPEPEEDFFQDWALNDFVASKQDLTESPKHSHVNMQLLEEKNNLANCYFIGSEYSQSEPGYMEGAIDAVDAALSSFIDE